MSHFTEDKDQFVLHTPELELGFSRESGALTLLRRPNGLNVLGYGIERAAIDVRLGQRWLGVGGFVRYLRHEWREHDGGIELTITVASGPLRVYDRFWITGALIARSLTLQNVGIDEVQLTAIRLHLPWACIGDPSASYFVAPSNLNRTEVLMSIAARQHDDTTSADPEFTPLVRRNRLFEEAPDRGPGLLGIYAPYNNETLLCWFWSRSESSRPQIDGNRQAITLTHEVGLAGWLRTYDQLTTGTQYVLLTQARWPEPLQAFQRIQQQINQVRAVSNRPGWVRESPIYEVHAAQFGGFCGLTKALPRLHDLGFRVLNLMPIWEFDNRTGKLWDGNWRRSGSPYAIRDFERFDPTLGTADDFRRLVETAHRLDMRVLCDLVIQGCATSARYVTEQPDWFARDAAGRLVSSQGWTDTYSFDWANPQYQQFVLDWTMRLVRDFGIDGFRVDAPSAKEPNWDRRLDRPASSTAFGSLQLLDRLHGAIKTHNHEAVLLCELYGPVFATQHDYAYDYLAHFAWFNATLGRITPADLADWLEQHWLVLPPDSVRVAFTETHDTRDVHPLADGLRGSRISRLVLAGLVLTNFVPMIWSGQEERPYDAAFLRQLLAVRRAYGALRYGTLHLKAMRCSDPQVFTVLRHHEYQRVVGLLNLSAHKRTVELFVPTDLLSIGDGLYHLVDMLTEEVIVEDGQQAWTREQFWQLWLTLDPWTPYLLDIRPGAPPRAEIENEELRIENGDEGEQAVHDLDPDGSQAGDDQAASEAICAAEPIPAVMPPAKTARQRRSRAKNTAAQPAPTPAESLLTELP